MLTKVRYEELIQRISSEARTAVVKWWNAPGTSALVYFENPNGNHRGEASVLAVGPKRMVKKIEDVVGTHLNELPDLRQYPRFYCEKDTR